ncbi:hypothetical protein J1N35_021220 [Gossypium stocksii]|uniref:Uncharacterized protein n=1 Tax=Gossypium stocksii TaxID=47602 RepID=A0A9D4A280_9ROSI|nr:hypothetical protein J1N35_021220 [Gossypium stocksii]
MTFLKTDYHQPVVACLPHKESNMPWRPKHLVVPPLLEAAVMITLFEVLNSSPSGNDGSIISIASLMPLRTYHLTVYKGLYQPRFNAVTLQQLMPLLSPCCQ